MSKLKKYICGAICALTLLSPHPAPAQNGAYQVGTLGSESCPSPADENKLNEWRDIFLVRPAQERWFVRDNVIHLRGKISSGDEHYFKTLAAQVGDKLRKVNVISQGGVTSAGISIGEYLHKHNLSVEIAGPCLSSCANYLFGFAKHKVILADGFLGFHGNVTALINERGGIERLPEISAEIVEKTFEDLYPNLEPGEIVTKLEKRIPKELKALKKKYPDLDPSEIVTKVKEMLAKNFEDDIRPEMNSEKQMYGFFGIPQSFFDKTQSIKKGYEGDDDTVDFTALFPDKTALLSLGFSSTFGKPNLCSAYHLIKKIRKNAPTSILVAAEL